MKLISWNVNGLRAILNKGFEENFNKLNEIVLKYLNKGDLNYE